MVWLIVRAHGKVRSWRAGFKELRADVARIYANADG